MTDTELKKLNMYIEALKDFQCDKCTARSTNCNFIPPPILFGYETKTNITPLIIITGYPKAIDHNNKKMCQTPDKGRLKHWLKCAKGTSFYLTNAVKCITQKEREPTIKEIITCSNIYLFNELKLIQPKVIITLGYQALKSLYSKRTEKELNMFMLKKQTRNSYKNTTQYVYPVYHPSYIDRGGAVYEQQCINLITDAFEENIKCQS